MSERPPPPSSGRPPSSRSKPSKTAQSGQHPAVKVYRAKLDSVAEGATVAMNELDRSLREFIQDLKTPASSRG